MKNEHYTKVIEFMNTFGQDVFDEPTMPTMKTALLRYNLIKEEVNELQEALEQDDMVEIADAISDIIYVAYGALASFGLKCCVSNFDREILLEQKIPSVKESFYVLEQLKMFLSEIMFSYTKGDLSHLETYINRVIYEVYKFSAICGIDFRACFNEVHDSNMSKTCVDRDQALRSIKFRLEEEGNMNYQDAYVEEINHRFVIKRKADGKALKGIDYYEPNLKQFIFI